MFEQLKKEYRDAPITFRMHVAGLVMHVIGTLAVIYEVASSLSLIPGPVRVEAPHGPPTVLHLFGIRSIIKICALLFIQWTIAKAQAWLQAMLVKSQKRGPLLYLVVATISILAAWLTIVNLNWIFFSEGLWTMIENKRHAELSIGAIATILAIGVHIAVFVSHTDSVEADKDFEERMTFGYVTYFLGLVFVLIAAFAEM
jgi:hypothetical protein